MKLMKTTGLSRNRKEKSDVLKRFEASAAVQCVGDKPPGSFFTGQRYRCPDLMAAVLREMQVLPFMQKRRALREPKTGLEKVRQPAGKTFSRIMLMSLQGGVRRSATAQLFG